MSRFALPLGLAVDRPFVASDTETTGLDPRNGARIVEVAFLRFQKGEVVDKLVSLLNPGCPIPAEATAIHGITDAMVCNAPTFAAVLPEILAFVEEDPIVFHNVPFDLPFLCVEAERAGTSWPSEIPIYDSCELARRSQRFPDAPSFSLEALSHRLRIAREFHRAEGDAYATGRLMLHLMKGGAARRRPWRRLEKAEPTK